MDLAGTTEKQLEEWSAAVSKYQMLLASGSWILRDWSQMTSRNMLNHFMLHQPFRSIFFPGSHCIPSGFVRLLDALTCGRCFRIPSPPQKGLWSYWRCLQARFAGFPDSVPPSSFSISNSISENRTVCKQQIFFFTTREAQANKWQTL